MNICIVLSSNYIPTMKMRTADELCRLIISIFRMFLLLHAYFTTFAQTHITDQCCETGVMPIMKQSHNAQTITSAELYCKNITFLY